MPGEAKKLNRFQRRWCEIVVTGVNGTEALRRMGWKGTRPDVKSAKLGALEHVRAYIAELDARAAERAGVTRTMVLRQLKAIATLDLRSLYKADGSLKEISKLDDDTAAALSALEIEELSGDESKPVRGHVSKVKTWSKTEALRLLAQILGQLKDQMELSGPGGGPVKYERIEIVGVPANKNHESDSQ